jgi:SPP1 family predicted phage head-tail adaptor
MKVGRLRHRVTLQEFINDPEPDSDGAVTEDWFTVASGISAEITAMSGREFVAAQAIQSEVDTRIKMRFRPGLKAAMRVLHREVTYNIEAIMPDPKSGIRYLVLLCKSGVNSG